jgi:AcrR family transcriptional regulator
MSRRYRMSRRASSVDATRQRIVAAAVELHGTVGPAATTVLGVAEAAGVTRATVYRHFADDEALFAACSAHWMQGQRLPDPGAWLAFDDPETRLRVGLADLYRFYRDGEQMLTRIYRDWWALPDQHRATVAARNRQTADLLRRPFGRGRLVSAAVGHAVAFWTWRSLCLDEGLPNAAAVELMVALVASAAASSSGRTVKRPGHRPATRR